MKNNVMTIFKKEASRIVHDQKLFFSAVIMPGLLMFVMFFLMGNFMTNVGAVDEDHVYQVHAVNMPASVAMMLSAPELNMEITTVVEANAEQARQQVADRDIDLLLVFPADFDAAIAAYTADPPKEFSLLPEGVSTSSIATDPTIINFICLSIF